MKKNLILIPILALALIFLGAKYLIFGEANPNDRWIYVPTAFIFAIVFHVWAKRLPQDKYMFSEKKEERS